MRIRRKAGDSRSAFV